MKSTRNPSTPPPSNRVITQVARRKGVEPESLPPLYHVVDPALLDELFESGFEGTLSFEYAGYGVRVREDGEVRVCDCLERSATPSEAGDCALRPDE